jgi:predicted Zn-dependent peptidase
MPGNSRITIQVAWPTSRAYEGNHNPAVPLIATRLLLAGGAKDYPAGETIERMSDMNTQGELWEERDYVFGVLHFSPEHSAESVKIANAHILTPAFDEKWFERIKNEYAEQMKEAGSQSRVQGYQAFRWATFQDTPLREALSIPDEDVIDRVKHSMVVEWAKTAFKRNGVVIAVAGDITAAEAGGLVDQLFEGVPEGKATVAGTSAAKFSAQRIVFHAPESPTSTLSVIGKLPPASEGSYYQDFIIANLLSGGFESGLSGAVRTDLRAAYTFGAQVEAISHEHRILVMAGLVETTKLAQAEQSVLEAYTQFRANPSLKGLSAMKKRFKTGLKEDLKDTGSVAYDAMISKIYGMDSSRALALLDEIDAITEESIKNRLNTAFPKADELTVIVDSPDAKALPDACVITVAKEALDC